MAIRWMLSPLTLHTVTFFDEDAQANVSQQFLGPKFALYKDPATGFEYPRANVIGTDNRCLSFVRGVNWTPIDADAQCVNVLQRDYESNASILNTTPRADGWTNNRWTQFTTRATQAGFNVTGLSRDSTFHLILNHIGKQIDPNFDAAGNSVL